MAAQSTFEAQSFADHTSAPSSTTTSLATPSAMSTACDGGREWDMADNGTPLSLQGPWRFFGAPGGAVWGQCASACKRVLDGGVGGGATQDRHTCNRSRRLVGHRCLEEHRSRRELSRRGHGVQPLHRRDVSIDVAHLRAQNRSPPSAAAPPRAGFYCVAGYRRPPPPLWRRSGCVRLRASQRP